MTKITPIKLTKLNELSKNGLSNHQIAKILNISYETVRKYKTKNVKKLGSKIVKNEGEKVVKRSIKVKKRDRKRGVGAPGDIVNKERKRESDHTIQDSNASGEKSGSVENLIFVGGKKYMPEKEKSKTNEEDEYQCYNCDHIQGSIFEICPKCGTKNVFEE